MYDGIAKYCHCQILRFSQQSFILKKVRRWWESRFIQQKRILFASFFLGQRPSVVVTIMPWKFGLKICPYRCQLFSFHHPVFCPCVICLLDLTSALSLNCVSYVCLYGLLALKRFFFLKLRCNKQTDATGLIYCVRIFHNIFEFHFHFFSISILFYCLPCHSN